MSRINHIISGTVPIMLAILLFLLGFAIQNLPEFMIVAMIVVGVYIWFNRQELSKSMLMIGIFFILSGGIWIIFRPLAFWILALGLLIIFHLLIWLHIKTSFIWVKWLKIGCSVVLTVLFIGMQLIMIKPGIIVPLFQQKLGYINSYHALSLPHSKLSKGIKAQFNISYGKKYPRSYLDVFTKKGQSEAPTVIYLHGGGWIAGDKSAGDPNQSGNKKNYQIEHFEKTVKAGYNVVSLNYALAPAYPYPTQLKQISQAVKFLQSHAKQLNINMDKVVISGSSAGGNLAADFVTLQVNLKHPQAKRIKPVLSRKVLKAMVLEVPATDMTQVNHTYRPVHMNDYFFGISVMSYTNQPMVSYDETYLDKISPINYVTKDMPPTFITDGNTGSFMKANQRYAELLKKAGVPVELYIPTLKEGTAGHGFLADLQSPMTQKYLKDKWKFLEKYTYK